MNIRVGYIPYINMVPFHRGFGPEALKLGRYDVTFQTLSPRGLGIAAANQAVDAGALSLVDGLALQDQFEPLGQLGIGVQREAQSVLLFSKEPLQNLGQAMIGVSDETSTSYRLLEVLLEKQQGLAGVRYGRVASAQLYNGRMDGLLLIGDEALAARTSGIKGLPIVTDLGEAWYAWQNSPFVFARWMVRRDLPHDIKVLIKEKLESSLDSIKNDNNPQHAAYWGRFIYRLTDAHLTSIERFERLYRTPSHA